ncbi:MAG: hypothetical protein ACKOAG_11020, partial [Candidatus Kapaibacterium sp.]
DTLGYVVGDGIYRTIRPQSAPSIAVRGDTVFCEGGAVTLTAASGFTEYRWSNGTTTPVIEARKTGTYFVTVRKGNDCPLVSNSVRVRVLPAPLPGLLSSRTTKHLCFDDSLELRIAGGFRSVRWSTGDSSLAIVVRTAGTYTVTVTDTNGCVGLDSVAITGGTKIVPRVGRTGNIRFCSGDSLVLRAQEGFDTYRWSTNATSPSIVVRTDGSYSVTVTDRYGCVWQSDTVNVTVDTNPIEITGLPGGRLVIDSTRPHSLRCDSVRVRNVSARMLTISTARLLRNIEFSVPQSQLDLVLQPGEERGLAVCYQPSQMNLQRDTIVIGDYCNRVLIVESAGVPDHYVSQTRCDVPLTGSTSELNTTGLYVYPTYPQPADSRVTLRVRTTSGDGIEAISATDLLGVTGELPVLSVIRTPEPRSSVVEEATVDVSGLETGTYALHVRTRTGRASV